MKFRLKNLKSFLGKVYFLSAPYGRKRLLLVFGVILAQGFFQVIGVSSIFPFLALAANPTAFRDSGIGSAFLRFLPEMDDSQLLLLAGIFALLMLLISNVVMLLGEVVRTWYAQGYAHWLRMRLLNRILQNPYSYFLQRNTGELLKKAAGDVGSYVGGVLAPLLESSAKVITVVFLLLTLILINPLLALGAAVGFGVFYSSIFYLLKIRREKASHDLKIANRGTMREAQQLLGGIKPVKVHGVESIFLARYAGFSGIQASILKWFPVYQNAPRYLVEPVAFGGIVVLVLLLAAQGENLTNLIPTLGVVALAGYRLIPNFQLLYSSLTGMSLMMHSLEEVYEEFLETQKDQPLGNKFTYFESGLGWKRSLELNNVGFSYTDANKPVIQNLSLTIRRNQFVAFIGETGSGKSTLIDILLGLHWPQKGQLLVDGKPLTPDNIRKWRAGIGYVPQEIYLLDDTVAANIAFGVEKQKINMAQVRKVADVAQILQFIETEMPLGFNTNVGERGVRLSGGQRQRIGLARALYHGPSLLVLDEATSALDTTTETALMTAIESLHGDMTMVVIAHRLTTVQKADVIFELSHGSINRQGTFNELKLNVPIA